MYILLKFQIETDPRHGLNYEQLLHQKGTSSNKRIVFFLLPNIKKSKN